MIIIINNPAIIFPKFFNLSIIFLKSKPTDFWERIGFKTFPIIPAYAKAFKLV